MIAGSSHSGPAAPSPAATTSSAEPSVAALLSVVSGHGTSADPDGAVVADTAPAPAAGPSDDQYGRRACARFPSLDLIAFPHCRVPGTGALARVGPRPSAGRRRPTLPNNRLNIQIHLITIGLIGEPTAWGMCSGGATSMKS